MVTQTRALLHTLVLLIVVHLSQPVCVEIQSATEAVVGRSMILTCIVCMKREDVKAKTCVDWYFRPSNEDAPKLHIYQYKDDRKVQFDGPFKGRLSWSGNQDLQNVSLRIHNITFNDSGIYECHVTRQFEFKYFNPTACEQRNITLTVKEKASEDTTALYSEIMMYVLLVFLTFWLLVEMVYCYRKISKSDEQAQDTATNYLAIPSEQKDNPAAPVTE